MLAPSTLLTWKCCKYSLMANFRLIRSLTSGLTRATSLNTQADMEITEWGYFNRLGADESNPVYGKVHGRVWILITLRWRHNDHDGGSNHQPHGCVLNRLLRRKSKKTSKLRFTGLCVGNSPGPVNSPHKGPVTRKMFPFDDVIMRHGMETLPTLLALCGGNTGHQWIPHPESQ